MSLTKEQLLGLHAELPKESVTVEGSAEPVIVRALTNREMDVLMAMNKKHKKKSGVLALIACVCDENGKRLFEYSDVDQFAEYPWHIINTISLAANRVNGINIDDDDEDDDEEDEE